MNSQLQIRREFFDPYGQRANERNANLPEVTALKQLERSLWDTNQYTMAQLLGAVGNLKIRTDCIERTKR